MAGVAGVADPGNPARHLPSPGLRRGQRGTDPRRPPRRGKTETVIRSDPAKPLADPYDGDYGSHDYRKLPGKKGVAVFETAPFTEAYEMAGEVLAEISASATVPDFDLWCQLYDVAPDGTAWNLAAPGTGLLRASYRDGGPERRVLRQGEVVRLRIGPLVTANRFLPGHRLRIALSTAFFPLFSVNPQTGEPGDRSRPEPGPA